MHRSYRFSILVVVALNLTTHTAIAGGADRGGSVSTGYSEIERNALTSLSIVKTMNNFNDFVFEPITTANFTDPISVLVNKTVFYVGEKLGAFPSDDADTNVFWEGAMALPVVGKYVKLVEPMVESPMADDPSFGGTN